MYFSCLGLYVAGDGRGEADCCMGGLLLIRSDRSVGRGPGYTRTAMLQISFPRLGRLGEDEGDTSRSILFTSSVSFHPPSMTVVSMSPLEIGQKDV